MERHIKHPLHRVPAFTERDRRICSFRNHLTRRQAIHFRWLWIQLCRTYQVEPHCFTHGSSRETLSHWVCNTVGRQFVPSELRNVLEEAVRRGWCDKIQVGTSYTRYFPRERGKKL